MREINEPDWKVKVLRRVHPLALERFCEHALAEIDRVSRDDAKSHHARYLEIFRIIKERDREIARLFDNPRRSHALTMLAQIRAQGLLTDDEFSSLSTRNARCHSNAARRRIKLHMAARSRFSTSSVIDSKYLIPCSPPTKSPARDYFFRYRWILVQQTAVCDLGD